MWGAVRLTSPGLSFQHRVVMARPSTERLLRAVNSSGEASISDRPSFSITELAHEFDITPRAIRFYEDVGLLQPSRAGRHRVYSHRDRTRLKLTLRGKRLGLSLLEIKQLVDMYESGTDARPQLEAFLEVLQSHRRQLVQQMEDIQVTLSEIEQHEARCRSLLAASVVSNAPTRRRSSGRPKP
jgi:DNA-binding transcriptional MerR regulator